jgi:D-glycerate 3-kinase
LEPYCLPTAVFSLDDFYLTHADQQTLAKLHADNLLIQHRGLPGTHDLPLALNTFKSLRDRTTTKIPVHNKYAFEDQGDRAPEPDRTIVNIDLANTIEVVLFEGWSIGFRAISPQSLLKKYNSAVAVLNSQPQIYHDQLAHNTLKSLTTINRTLRIYDTLTDHLDTFIHLKAADLQYVYKWRLQQEARLRSRKGFGMTNEQVQKFVDGYFSAYELYSDEMYKGSVWD